MKKKFNDKYYLKVSDYFYNGRLYIGIVYPNGNLYSDVTINLPEIPLKHNNQIFLNGDLSKSTKNKLIAKGIISKQKGIQQYNMGKYEIADVNFDVLKEYDSQGVEEFLKNSININDSFEQYNNAEVKKLLKKNTRLVYVSDGTNEIVVRYEDLPDVIVDFNYKFGLTNLRVCDYKNPSLEPLLTTNGYFLDKCDLKVRADIIDRLIELQTGQEEIKDYKICNTDILEKLEQENDLKKDNQEKEM